MPVEKDESAEALVRRRAHEIWEREGRPLGKDEHHWHQARAELAAERLSIGNADDASKTSPAGTTKSKKRR